MATVPICFGFTTVTMDRAVAQARSVALSVSIGGGPEDVSTLIKIALYCSRMCERLARSGEFEDDGLADVATAVNSGAEVVGALSQRLAEHSVVRADADETAAIDILVDAYEAIFKTATRRASAEVLAEINRECA